MASPLATLQRQLREAGYYPQFVADTIDAALAGEELVDFYVHLETTFDSEEVRRHETVLALTPTRLLLTHVDDHGPDELEAPSAAAATEAVPLRNITSVLTTVLLENPQDYRSGREATVVTVGIGWGAVRRIDLEPATCGDPACEADHGLTGSAAADDIMIRVSSNAEGPDAVSAARRFAARLSLAAGAR